MNLTPEIVADVLSSDRLHLMIMPTEACNFRCTYCYEEFRSGRMSADIVAGIEAYLTRRIPELDTLDVSWFGGEPLAAADTVLDILGHVRAERRSHPDLRFRSDMTTNGWFLDRDTFDRLLALGVTRYQISFDGPREHHDRKRVRAGGSGTFDRIGANLRSMQETPGEFLVDIRLHVDRDNADACPAFLRWMSEEFHGDSRFRLFPRLLSRWGGPNDADLSVYGSERGGVVLEGLERLARELGIPLHPKPEGPVVCYAARSNSFLIRADGRINKCTLALSAPENQVGHLTRDGRLELNDRLSYWMRGFWNESLEALGCPKDAPPGENETVEAP